MPNKRTGQDYLEYRKNPEPTRPIIEHRKTTPKKKTESRWEGSSLTKNQQREVELNELKDKLWLKEMKKKYSSTKNNK